ncbi:MerR family transcriptional regulator [Streptococcus ferus]|uniref:Transcriptional regulator n=1 Tax=Streptococcus ferus TaxID=1345 RepID=A0A2X3VC36_9STRE|nr:MerR family transcriptional regulator [Streptococcus ferus]SQF38970.1 transcriptional regulator [Streptococcus ferus]
MAYLIGEFAKRTGLTIHTLRYYEKLGLLHPKRTSGNVRYYDQLDERWLAMILRLKATGMPIKDMQRFAALREQGEATYAQRMNLLQQHLQHLDGEVAQLLANREKLVEKIQFYNDRLQENGSS